MSTPEVVAAKALEAGYWINMQTAFDMAAAAKTVDVSGIDPITA